MQHPSALVRSTLALAAVAAALPAASQAAGKQIVFQSNRVAGGDTELYWVAPDGTGFTRLTTHAGSDTDPAISPNGKKIASIQYVGGQGADIYVMKSSGLDPVRVTTTPGVDEADPAWSPNSKLLAFEIRDAAGHLQIAVIKPSGKGYKQLTHGNGDSRDPSFSPDGTKIVYVSTVDGPQACLHVGVDGSMAQRLTSDPDTADSPVSRSRRHPDRVSRQSHQLVALNLTSHAITARWRWASPAARCPTTRASRPDGTQIAFQTNASDPSSEIAVVKLDGTGLHYPAPNLQNGLLGIDLKPCWG